MRPTLNYKDNSYAWNKDASPPSVVGQRFGENKACIQDGRIFGTWDNVCPAPSISLYTYYGMKGHNGLDIPCMIGDSIYAAHDGTIAKIEIDGNGGWGVRLLSDIIEPYKDGFCRFETLYWHIMPNPPVKKGQKVRVGDLIAFGGNTGAASTASHLHWGLKPRDATTGKIALEAANGYYGAIDPSPYIVEENAVNWQKIRILTALVEAYKKLIALYMSK